MAFVHPGGQLTLMPPPQGYVSNFANPERQYTENLYYVSGFLAGLTILFMAQRLYINVWVSRTVALEDGLLFAGWALIVVETVMILRTVAKGSMGTHIYELELAKFLEFMVDFYPMPIVYPLCMMFTKLSLLVFYLRISPGLPHRYACFFGMFFVFGAFFSLTFVTAFPCKPLALSWNPTLVGTCIDRPASYKATAILGLLTDFYIIILPIPTIVGLQMPWQQKVGVIAVFGIGGITIVTSIMRLIVIIQVLSDADVSWGSAPTAFWLVIEAHLMVICATLPSLRKFFRHVAPKLIGERSSPSTDNSTIPSELVTYGRNQSKKTYDKFKDDTLCDKEESDKDVPYGVNIAYAVDIESARRQDKAEHNGSHSHDGDSQKGILTTTETTVHY